MAASRTNSELPEPLAANISKLRSRQAYLRFPLAFTKLELIATSGKPNVVLESDKETEGQSFLSFPQPEG